LRSVSESTIFFGGGSEWRAKRESYLETKDKASKDKVKQLESDAKAALDAFNKEYQAKKDATKKKNKYGKNEQKEKVC